MSRPSHINADQILDAARAIFLERGFHETSIALIAERAGISEGSIFNHFKNKRSLFAAAMQIRSASILDSLHDRVGKGKPREALIALTTEWLTYVEELLPKLMMVWSHRSSLRRTPVGLSFGPGRSRRWAGPPPEVVAKVSAYFRGEMGLGRIRTTNPEILARVWLDVVWSYAMSRIMSAGVVLDLSAETYVAAVIDQLWHGLAPKRSRNRKLTKS